MATVMSSSRQPLQLEQWSNDLAPLTSQQRASVNRLADWLHRNSQEYKLATYTSQPPKPSSLVTDDQTGKAADQSGKKAALNSLASPSSVTLPDSRAPLSSAQDFLAWFTYLSTSITSATQSSHQRALTEISNSTQQANSLLEQLESCQINVSELRAGSAFVEESSKGLREEARALLGSQVYLDNLSQDISSRLSFFTLLPYATSILSSPDSSVVYSQEFLDLLDQLEMALLFLQHEPARDYKDAALYRMRYGQCVTRGATLAKIAVCRDFQSAGKDLAARSKEAQVRASSGSAKGKEREVELPGLNGSAPPISSDLADYIYESQGLSVTRLRPLIHELERRAFLSLSDGTEPESAASSSILTSRNAAEFESLLEECKAAWFVSRRHIISKLATARFGQVEAALNGPASPSPDDDSLQKLARHCGYLIEWFISQELELYRKFFRPVKAVDDKASNEPNMDAHQLVADQRSSEYEDLHDDATLKAYLQGLADILHSRLRPRILKETRDVTLEAVSGALRECPLMLAIRVPYKTKVGDRYEQVLDTAAATRTPLA